MFKVGQKVVCINSQKTHTLVKGKIYTVTGKSKCRYCRESLIEIEGVPDEFHKCGKCKVVHQCDRYYRIARFRPLQWDIIPNKDIIEEMVKEKLDIPVREPQTV